jgi:transcriptional regulator with PAS, ATPase and Fis domain
LVRTPKHLWVKEFPAAITVCDKRGVLLEMNAKSAASFRDEGGEKLIGKNAFDCHPEPARTIFRKLMKRRQTNVYTIEKRGKRKLIYQTPWYKAGKFRGFVELSIELPSHIPHFNRDRQNRR